MSAGGPPTAVFLDIDVDGHRAAHKRAVDFVSANSIKYGLSSADLRELGGSERAREPAAGRPAAREEGRAVPRAREQSE